MDKSSMTTIRSAKAKGRRFQKWVAEEIRVFLGMEKEHVVSAPASVNGVDIILSDKAKELFPFAVECKNQEKLNIWSAIDQARDNAPDPFTEPIVIFSKNKEEVWVAIRFNIFFNLVRHVLTYGEW